MQTENSFNVSDLGDTSELQQLTHQSEGTTVLVVHRSEKDPSESSVEQRKREERTRIEDQLIKEE